MKKVIFTLAFLTSGMFLSSASNNLKKVTEDILIPQPVANTVIVYTKNGHQYAVIVHRVLDCNSLTLGNVDSIDDCWHF